MSNIYNDPDFKRGWESQTAPGVTRFLRRLWESAKDVPGTITGILGSEPSGPSSGGGIGDPAEVAIAEGIEGLGWPDEEEGAGTPRVAPTARAGASGETPEVAPEDGGMPTGASVDYILGGSQNDAYSRLRSVLSDVTGQAVTDDEMAELLSQARRDIFGGMAPRYESGYDAMADFANPDALQALFMYLNG